MLRGSALCDVENAKRDLAEWLGRVRGWAAKVELLDGEGALKLRIDRRGMWGIQNVRRRCTIRCDKCGVSCG